MRWQGGWRSEKGLGQQLVGAQARGSREEGGGKMEAISFIAYVSFFKKLKH